MVLGRVTFQSKPHAWHSQCWQLVKQRGYEYVTANQLVQELSARGRAAVPAALRAELVASIKEQLRQAQ